jgi:hypothetical protein
MIITDGIHLVSTEDEEELHSFATKIGLKRGWYHGGQSRPRHPKRKRPHYDLTTKRAVKRAVQSGAKMVTGRHLLENAWWSGKR